MEREEIIKKSLRGAAIAFTATGLQFLIAFGTQVALARMLEPSHFGVLAFAALVAMFFNNFTNIHGDKYIIKEKNGIKEKLDNAFTLEILLAIVLIFLVVGIAPFLMKILGKPELTRFVQFLTLLFLYNPFSKPRSLFERKLSFFQARFPMVIAQLIGGIIGVLLAYWGYGVWSLIWWRIATLASETLIVWCIIPYRPRLALNGAILRKITSFGLPLLGSGVLVFFYSNIDYYIVGKLLGEEQLGYYWLAFQVSHYFLRAKTALNSVIFPAFSRTDSLLERYKGFKILTDIVGALYLVPTVIVLFWGKEIIYFIMGEKWLPSLVPFKIFFVIVLIRAIGGSAGPLFYSQGITHVDVVLSVLNILLMIPAIYCGTILLGINGAALAVLLVGFISVGYGYEKYVRILTDHGFLYYFIKPLIGLLLAFLAVSLGNYLCWAFVIKTMTFIAIMVLLYVFYFKEIGLKLYSVLKKIILVQTN